MATMLDAAIWYRKKRDFAVIPVSEDKTPLIKWQKYQTEKPSLEQVEEWWSGKFKGANIGIVTGAISNLTVVDIDSEQGREAIEEITPEAMLTPTASSPSGGEHRYFKYEEGIGNAVRFLSDCDVRSEGGYIIAPPSENGRGKYAWKEGLSIADIETAFLPEAYKKALNEYIPYMGASNKEGFRGLQRASEGFINLSKNHKLEDHTRDNTLFHIANALIKSQIPDGEVQQILQLIAFNGCETPFPAKEVPIKIQSAINRAEKEKSNWMAEVKELIEASKGVIRASECHRELQGASKREKRAITQCLRRCEKDGLLKKTGRVAGEYRIINTGLQEVDWKNSSIEDVKLTLPLGIHECVKFVPSSVVLISGVTNAGKTAFAMSIAYLNWKRIETLYFTSEIGGHEFKTRVLAHSDIPSWEEIKMFNGFESNELPDLIKPDALNIIDYLEPPAGDYTQVATVMTDIQRALKKGIAVICLQKKEGDEYGAGGQFIKNKPHLSLTLDPVDYPVCRVTIRKAKAMQDGYRNPGGQSVDYKIDNDGVSIVPYGKFHFSKWR